jgi:short-subunit dehydrogenase
MYTQALAAELRSESIDVLTLCPGPTRTAFGRRAGFALGSLPGAFSPETVARQGLDALGRRPVHMMGPVSRSLLALGLTAQHVVAQGLGVAMRLLGRRGLDQSAA